MSKRILCNETFETRILQWFVADHCLIFWIPTFSLELVVDHSTMTNNYFLSSILSENCYSCSVISTPSAPVNYSITWSSLGLWYGWQRHSSRLASSRWLQKHNRLGASTFKHPSDMVHILFPNRWDSFIPISMLFCIFVTEKVSTLFRFAQPNKKTTLIIVRNILYFGVLDCSWIES